MKTLNDYLKEAGLNPKDSSWNCRGKTVVLHKALEVLAKRAKISFGDPQIMHMDVAGGNMAILVVGIMPNGGETGTQSDIDREWAFGEINSKNHTTAYPFAVVEKRAKDRVILKLLGIHGEVYSESEADDFKQPAKKEYSRMDSKMDAPKGVDIDDIFN